MGAIAPIFGVGLCWWGARRIGKTKIHFNRDVWKGRVGHPLCVTGRLSDEEWSSGSNERSE